MYASTAPITSFWANIGPGAGVIVEVAVGVSVGTKVAVAVGSGVNVGTTVTVGVGVAVGKESPLVYRQRAFLCLK